MKSLVKRSVALLLSAVMSAGACGALLTEKGNAASAAPSAQDIMYGQKMEQYFKTTSNRENSPIVYFGKTADGKLPIEWIVVGADGVGVARENNAGATTLLSKRSLKEMEYAHAYADDYFLSKLMTETPKLVKVNTFEDFALKAQSHVESSTLKNVKVWPLSLRQASGLAFSLRNMEFEDGTSTKCWWTRTPNFYYAFAMSDGLLGEKKVSEKAGVRPAVNIDLTKVAFLTATGEKDQYLTDGLVAVRENAKNEWKLVLKDAKSQKFSAELDGSSELPIGGEVSLSFKNAYAAEDAGVFAMITDENGAVVKYGLIADGSAASGEATFTIPEDLPAGEYGFKVFSSRYNEGKETEICTNIVDISISAVEVIPAPGPVSNAKAEMAGKNKVTLSWNEYEGVEGYHIYASKGEAFEQIGTVEKGEETTFTDENAKDTSVNKYWIVAFVTDKQGNVIEREVDPQGEADAQSKGGCPAVTGLKASAQKGKVKLTWEASPEAEGYLIYGIRPDAPYGYIGMTTLGTTFTDTNASTEGWNFYWVFPYYKEGNEIIVGGTPKYTYGRAR